MSEIESKEKEMRRGDEERKEGEEGREEVRGEERDRVKEIRSTTRKYFETIIRSHWTVFSMPFHITSQHITAFYSKAQHSTAVRKSVSQSVKRKSNVKKMLLNRSYYPPYFIFNIQVYS